MNKKYTAAALELAIVLLVTLIAFVWAKCTALLEQGYTAYGGEFLFLLIPVIYYITKQIAAEIHQDEKARPGKTKAKVVFMKRLKRRIFSGAMCEQIVFSVPDRLKNLDNADPRPRFKTETEREEHKLGISRRKHARIVNNNFGPSSFHGSGGGGT